VPLLVDVLLLDGLLGCHLGCLAQLAKLRVDDAVTLHTLHKQTMNNNQN
jgi:hypothetical protein